MHKVFILAALLIIPGIALADSHDNRVAEVWQCELKEGKKMEDVKANNVKWLANARKGAGSDEINSYALESVVGDLTKFVFIDSYPNMAAWAAGKSADATEEGKAIEAAFNELIDCDKNRLYKTTKF